MNQYRYTFQVTISLFIVLICCSALPLKNSLEQEDLVHLFNHAVTEIQSPFESIELEELRINLIHDLLEQYFDLGGRHEHSIETMKSTALSNRIEQLLRFPEFTTDMKYFEYLDALCVRMIENCAEQDRAMTLQNAAIHFHNAGQLAASAHKSEALSANRFIPSNATRMAWQAYQMSDLYIEYYESLTGKKSTIPKVEWSPF